LGVRKPRTGCRVVERLLAVELGGAVDVGSLAGGLLDVLLGLACGGLLGLLLPLLQLLEGGLSEGFAVGTATAVR